MAQYTYNEPTNREDLTDVVTNISPTQTPITSMIGKTKANATYHEFPQDVLADAAANAHVEGEKDTAVAAAARTRSGNYTQIMKKGYNLALQDYMPQEYIFRHHIELSRQDHIPCFGSTTPC